MRYHLQAISLSIAIAAVVSFLLVQLSSCNRTPQKPKHPKYLYVKDDYLSDTAKIDMAYWITETMKASSSQMTGGDYEDPEDVIEQLEETGTRLFSKKVDGLKKWNSNNGYWGDFIPVYELNKYELQVLDSLKNQ